MVPSGHENPGEDSARRRRPVPRPNAGHRTGRQDSLFGLGRPNPGSLTPIPTGSAGFGRRRDFRLGRVVPVPPVGSPTAGVDREPAGLFQTTPADGPGGLRPGRPVLAILQP